MGMVRGLRRTGAAAIMTAVVGCHARSARDGETWRVVEPVVRAAIAAERDAFVRGDGDAAVRASGLDTVHWPAIREQVQAAVRRRQFLVRRGHDYHTVLEARTTVDSARVSGDTATLWATALSVYAHRKSDGDPTAPSTMGEAVPHVFVFTKRDGAWVFRRDSIISDAERHRRSGPEHGATSARGPFRDRNAIDADIARGPVPGYAGVIIHGGCTFVVMLTDTVTQKKAAEEYFRSQVELSRPSGRSNCGGPYRLAFRQVR